MVFVYSSFVQRSFVCPRFTKLHLFDLQNSRPGVSDVSIDIVIDALQAIKLMSRL